MIVDTYAGRHVNTDESKLDMLNKKICADFLIIIKKNIDTQMNNTPMTMTYSYALANYRNTVNQRFPN